MPPEKSSSPAAPAPAAPVRTDLFWYLALAAPFVLCQAILLGSGRTLPVFWGGDESQFHWPLALQFAAALPHFDPDYSLSASTPLFHLLGACAIRVFGPHLTLARSLNVVFSLVGVYALFGLLRRSLRHGAATAALLSGVYLSSCYFFGYSFRWLTDNLALTFCILALAQLFRFAAPAGEHRLRTYLFGCLWFALTVLTRQNYLFLGLPFALALLASGLTPGAMATGAAGLVLAVAPFAALVATWHGLVPPAVQARHLSAGVNLYPISLPLMLLGLYSLFFVGPEIRVDRPAVFVRGLHWPMVGVGLAVVWMFPLVPVAGRPDLLTYFPRAARQDIPGYFAGWLYTAAAHFPKLHGNSLLFWLLLPVGLAAATRFALDAARPGSDPRQRVAILFLLGLLLASTLNSICAQKYYDAPILLFLIWHSRVEAARDPWRLTALGALILLFAAYFAVYVATAKPDATGLSQHAAKPVRFVAGKDEHRSAVLLAFARCDPGLQPQRGVDCGRFIAGFA